MYFLLTFVCHIFFILAEEESHRVTVNERGQERETDEKRGKDDPWEVCTLTSIAYLCLLIILSSQWSLSLSHSLYVVCI